MSVNKEEFIEEMKSCFTGDDIIKYMMEEQEKAIKTMEQTIFAAMEAEDVEDMTYKDIKILATNLNIQCLTAQLKELKKRLIDVSK